MSSEVWGTIFFLHHCKEQVRYTGDQTGVCVKVHKKAEPQCCWLKHVRQAEHWKQHHTEGFQGQTPPTTFFKTNKKSSVLIYTENIHQCFQQFGLSLENHTDKHQHVSRISEGDRMDTSSAIPSSFYQPATLKTKTILCFYFGSFQVFVRDQGDVAVAPNALHIKTIYLFLTDFFVLKIFCSQNSS